MFHYYSLSYLLSVRLEVFTLTIVMFTESCVPCCGRSCSDVLSRKMISESVFSAFKACEYLTFIADCFHVCSAVYSSYTRIFCAIHNYTVFQKSRARNSW